MSFRLVAVALTAALALTVPLAPSASAQELTPAFPRAPTHTDRFIVQFKPAAEDGRSQALAADPATREAHPEALAWSRMQDRARGLARRHGLPVRDIRGIAPGMVVVAVDESAGDTLAERLKALRADNAVAFVEPDYRRVAHAVPSDPLFDNQWYFKSEEPSAVRLDAGWDETTGHPDTIIAVLDTGVRFEHPDLKRVSEGGVLLDGYDFISGEGGGSFLIANDGNGRDPDPSDPGDWLTTAEILSDDFGPSCGKPEEPPPSSWHGTRVAGIVGALANNGIGIAGGAWQGAILPVRVLGKCGGYDSDIIAAMRWAAGLPVPGFSGPENPTPAQIINLSLGSETSCTNAYRNVMADLTAAGVLVVASAGNETGPVNSPANCPGVLAVAGLRHTGTKVGYSSFGPEVKVSAPAGNCVNLFGACLYSLTTTSNAGLTTPGSSVYTDPFKISLGTSFSAPIVATIAGLMRGINDNLTPAELTARIQASARPFPPRESGIPTCPSVSNNPDTAGQCNCTTSTCGAGMVNAAGAIADARRPIARVASPGTVSRGMALELDGTASQAARNRTIASWSWTVVTGTDVAIADAHLPTASVLVPESGPLTVRLTVTDDLGLEDSVNLVVMSGGGGASGGGGSPDGLVLALLTALALARRPQR